MNRWSALLSTAVVVVPLGVMSGTASASNDPIEVQYEFNEANSNFTDCPSIAVEMTCLGSAVQVSRVKSEIGDKESRNTSVTVLVFEIQKHADGTFAIGALVNQGEGTGRVQLDGTRSASVRASVAMADGSTATVRMSLAGGGPSSPYSGTATVDEPACPSGSAQVDYRGRTRDAIATGTLNVGPSAQVPTVAAGPAFLLVEHDEGHCVPM